ncbi:MAG: hypothetical protein COA33_006190 [Fluviicola sp.]|nr:hypothetical protein [Fluviicola sp.]
MKNFILLFCLVFSTLSFSQTKKYKRAETQEKANLQKDADWKTALGTIKKLKNGAILVALDFKKEKIAYFEKYENTKEANKIRSERLLANQQIINSFDSLFTFCMVYFFDVEDLHYFVNGHADSVTYYNPNLKLDPAITVQEDFFLVGNFGHVEQLYSKDSAGNWVYYSSKNSISAFVLRDQSLVQLRNPFPFYSPYHSLGLVKKRYNMPIRKFQAGLEAFEKNGVVIYMRREKRRVKRRAKIKARQEAKAK